MGSFLLSKRFLCSIKEAREGKAYINLSRL
ncbi:unnamed protein product [Linum tenue]|uniref:Uncharacterized protein n=1 Tax=Linum tenue TaxID=586396 RepID=A0AAV0RVI4_9ROSI|nr:unnamed protein product [Linum tenue]